MLCLYICYTSQRLFQGLPLFHIFCATLANSLHKHTQFAVFIAKKWGIKCARLLFDEMILMF